MEVLHPHLMGMLSPRTGAPSMISYFPSVSTSVRLAAPVPVTSRRRISSSMCFSFIRTCATDEQTFHNKHNIWSVLH